MPALQDLREQLQDSRSRLLRAISQVTEEQFKRRPPATSDDPSPWCIAEVLSHLLWTDNLWLKRIQLALDEEKATLTPSPPEAHDASIRAGRSSPVPQIIHGLIAARRQADRLLERAESLGETSLTRTAWHPRLEQDLSVEWMVREKLHAHEMEHSGQIERLRVLVGAAPVAPGG